MASGENKRYISRRSRFSLNPAGYVERLKNTDFFKHCSGACLQALIYHLKEEVFQPGEALIQQGEIGDCMYLLNVGVVDVSVNENHVAALHDGTLVGEIAVMASDPSTAKRTASIIAQTVCVCWKIDRLALGKIMSAFPKDREAITAYASERLRDLASKGLAPPEKKIERAWLRHHFQPKTSPKARKEHAVERVKLKFLNSLKKSSVAREEGSVEADVKNEHDNPNTSCSFSQPFRKQAAEVPQAGEVPHMLEKNTTCEYTRYLACVSTIDVEPRNTTQSEAGDTGSQMQDVQEEQPRAATWSESPLASSKSCIPSSTQLKDMLEIIYPKRGETLSMSSSTPKGFVLPPVMPPVKCRSSWSFRETAEVSKARTSAHDFLAKRGALT